MELEVNLATYEEDEKKSKIPDKEYPLLIKVIKNSLYGRYKKGDFFVAKMEFTGYDDKTTAKSHQGKWTFSTKPVQVFSTWMYVEDAEIIIDINKEKCQ
jgi:hypothetical protein